MSVPTDIDGVPVEEDIFADEGTEEGKEGEGCAEPDPMAASRDEELHEEHPASVRELYPAVPIVTCRALPSGTNLYDFLGDPSPRCS